MDGRRGERGGVGSGRFPDVGCAYNTCKGLSTDISFINEIIELLDYFGFIFLDFDFVFGTLSGSKRYSKKR